jgi:hypothetical protein
MARRRPTAAQQAWGGGQQPNSLAARVTKDPDLRRRITAGRKRQADEARAFERWARFELGIVRGSDA